MAAENNDSPSTLQQYLGFTTTRKRFEPKHYVSLTDYPIASDIKPAHRILSLTHRKCRGKPNIRILPPLLQKNNYDPPAHNIPDAPTKRYFFYKKMTKNVSNVQTCLDI